MARQVAVLTAETLVRFVALGGVVFALVTWQQDRSAPTGEADAETDSASRTIRVAQDDLLAYVQLRTQAEDARAVARHRRYAAEIRILAGEDPAAQISQSADLAIFGVAGSERHRLGVNCERPTRRLALGLGKHQHRTRDDENGDGGDLGPHLELRVVPSALGRGPNHLRSLRVDQAHVDLPYEAGLEAQVRRARLVEDERLFPP